MQRLFLADDSIESISDDLFPADTEFIYNGYGQSYYGIFSNCMALKKLPLWFKNMTFTVNKDIDYSPYTSPYYHTFDSCYALKEITLPIMPAPAKLR